MARVQAGAGLELALAGRRHHEAFLSFLSQKKDEAGN